MVQLAPQALKTKVTKIFTLFPRRRNVPAITVSSCLNWSATPMQSQYVRPSEIGRDGLSKIPVSLMTNGSTESQADLTGCPGTLNHYTICDRCAPRKYEDRFALWQQWFGKLKPPHIPENAAVVVWKTYRCAERIERW